MFVGHGESEPDRRYKYEYHEETDHLHTRPVAQMACPHLREVALYTGVRHHLFLLTLDQHICNQQDRQYYSHDKSNQGPIFKQQYPDSNVHEANMGPIWGRQDPGGAHVGAMNFAIRVV